MPVKITKSSYFTISFFIVIAVYACWWWIDSYTSCSTQDEYSLRGICLMQVEKRANNGEASAQWAYGDYLSAIGEEKNAEEWYRTALQNSKIALELMGRVGHCDKFPGFEHSTLESKIKRVVEKSPDGNLLLMNLYLHQQCGSFNLDKATATIPRLNQCAYLALDEYIRISKRKNYPITRKTLSDIQQNLELCRQELKNPAQDDSKLREFIPLTKEFFEDFSSVVGELTAQ